MNIQPLMYVHVSNVLLTKFSYFDILEENFDKSFVFSFPSLCIFTHETAYLYFFLYVSIRVD